MSSSGGTLVAKRGRPKRSERQDIAVKVDQRIAGLAKSVAKYRGIPLAELLSDLLEIPVSRAYAQMLRELNELEDGG